jgi:hypothetical protein
MRLRPVMLQIDSRAWRRKSLCGIRLGVKCDLAKVIVTSSILVSRSNCSHSIIALHGIGNAETEERNLLRAPYSAFSSMDRILGFEPRDGSSILSGPAKIFLLSSLKKSMAKP